MAGVSFREIADIVNADGAMVYRDGALTGMCVRLEVLHQNGPGAGALVMFEPFYDLDPYYRHRLDVVDAMKNSETAEFTLGSGLRIEFAWPADPTPWQNWLRYKAEHAAELDAAAARTMADQRAVT